MPPPDSKKTPNYFRLGFLIHDVSRLRRTVADRTLKPIGLTRSQFWILSSLSRQGEDYLVQTKLAEALDLGAGALGGLLDRLEANGLVRRVADPTDRRAKRIETTQAGIDLLAKAQVLALALNERMRASVSDAELALAEDVMDRLKAELVREEATLSE